MIKIDYHPQCIGTGNAQGDLRFALEQSGKRMLIVLGLNPSTADDSKMDPTMRRILGFAGYYDYDGFVMVNVNPVRATNADELPDNLEVTVKTENRRCVSTILSKYPEADILIAFGDKVGIRKYMLEECLELMKLFLAHSGKLYQLGGLTRGGNPRHPLFAPRACEFQEFDVHSFISAKTK